MRTTKAEEEITLMLAVAVCGPAAWQLVFGGRCCQDSVHVRVQVT